MKNRVLCPACETYFEALLTELIGLVHSAICPHCEMVIPINIRNDGMYEARTDIKPIKWRAKGDKSLLQNIAQLDDFGEEEKKQIAQAFEQGKTTPYAMALEKLLRKRIQHYYYELAHLKMIDTVSVAFVSGKIQLLEEILTLAESYIHEWIDEPERLEKEKEK